MVGQTATPSRLSANQVVDAGQTAVSAGCHTLIPRILRKTLYREHLNTCVVSIAIRREQDNQ